MGEDAGVNWITVSGLSLDLGVTSHLDITTGEDPAGNHWIIVSHYDTELVAYQYQLFRLHENGSWYESRLRLDWLSHAGAGISIAERVFEAILADPMGVSQMTPEALTLMEEL